MRAVGASLFLARFPAGVGFQIAIVLRVFELATEAVVLRHVLIVLGLALDATPVE